MRNAHSNVREQARKSRQERTRITGMPVNNRTRLGNGSALPRGIDGRSSAARRWKEIYREAMERSEGRFEQLCRSLATLVCRREQLDQMAQRGEDVDVLLLCRLSGEIRRLLARMGLDAEHEVVDGTQQALEALRSHVAARP
jgi:hypothetical protein